jgi:hypothetical protein
MTALCQHESWFCRKAGKQLARKNLARKNLGCKKSGMQGQGDLCDLVDCQLGD